ncbi:MAG: translation initiation factor IF-3 [Planctomycetes bacterium]|nr:translation initiation factor IF-3 [Planctomycetota bacterium]
MGTEGFRINEKIRVSPVRLIDESNAQIGVVAVQEALDRAREAGLDLVEVSPNSEPPVCRIMDYGKFLYQQKRKAKLSQKKQHVMTLKEIRMRPKIGNHDRDIKIKHAAEFLERGDKVQFTMMFRGREMMYVDHANEVMKEIVQTLQEIARVERPAELLGKRMNMILVPVKVSGSKPAEQS